MNNLQEKMNEIDEDTQFLIEQMYSVTPLKMQMPDGTFNEIPDEGNLGLLAFGYRGIIAWRKKREEAFGHRIYSPYLALLEKVKEQQKEDKE